MKKMKTTPQNQLLKLLQTHEQIHVLHEMQEVLNDQSQEDLCIAAIAYIKFGIRRSFDNNVLWALFSSYCDLLDR